MKKILFIFILLLFICPILASADQIDINNATLSQLDEIVHVGAKTAQKIIDERPFSSVQDLSRVKGIGSGKYLQDIIAQGFACVNCQTEVAKTAQPADTANQNLTDTTTPADAVVLQAPAIVYPAGIFINEILPNPQGADETNEWVELYNSNNFDVDLQGWQIADTKGTITTYAIPKDIKITANNYLVFKRPDTKIMLNNDEDGINLLAPDGKIVDSVNFTKAPLGKSYNKTNSGWVWSTTLTPGSKNIVALVATASAPAKQVLGAKTSVADLSNAENSVNNNDVEPANPWILFFTALAGTIILASIVLFIKLKLQKNVRT